MSAGDGTSERMDGALRALGEPGATVPPPCAELEALFDDCPPATTRSPGRDLAIAAGISVAHAGAVLALVTLRRDLRDLPVPWLVWFGSIWLAGYACVYALTLRPRRGDVMPRGRLAAVVALGFVGVLIALAAGAAEHAATSVMPELEIDTFFGYAYPCWLVSALTAIGPIAVGVWALRGAVPVGAGWIGFALGAGGGALGGFVLHLHCPIAHWAHVSMVHAVGILLCGVVAAVATAHLLRR